MLVPLLLTLMAFVTVPPPAAPAAPAPSRPRFHVSAAGPVTQLAGLVHHRGLYHLVYVSAGAGGGWAHATSADLAVWRELAPPLVPAEAHEAGARAGCLAPYDRYVALFYSGRAGRRHTQNIALTEDGGKLLKYCKNPIIETMEELGDPFVWSHGATWYMLLASRGPRGRLLLYSSAQLLQWQYQSVLAEAESAGVWEAPSLLLLDDADVLLLTVRKGRLSAAAYVVGTIDYSSGKFAAHGRAPFRMLDHGHDLRGVRTAAAADGRTLLVGLLGPMLSVPRELRAAAGRLLQTPARELDALRRERLESAWYKPGESYEAEREAFELLVRASPVRAAVELRLQWPGGAWVAVRYDWARGLVSLSRARDTGAGERRGAAWRAEAVAWRVFVDAGAVEVFCGEGEVVFSSWLDARGAPAVHVLGDTRVHLEQYDMKEAMRRYKGGDNVSDNEQI